MSQMKFKNAILEQYVMRQIPSLLNPIDLIILKQLLSFWYPSIEVFLSYQRDTPTQFQLPKINHIPGKRYERDTNKSCMENDFLINPIKGITKATSPEIKHL